MVQISGKYESVKNENFAELLKKAGYPADKVAAIDKSRAIVTLTVDGDKIITKVENVGAGVVENTLVLGKESAETHPTGLVVKTIATKEGDGLKFVSKADDGKIMTRLYKFTDSGCEVTMLFEGLEAKRIYKRL